MSRSFQEHVTYDLELTDAVAPSQSVDVVARVCGHPQSVNFEDGTFQDAERLSAAVEAAQVRFRPILRTSLVFILRVLPLVFASRESEGRQVHQYDRRLRYVGLDWVRRALCAFVLRRLAAFRRTEIFTRNGRVAGDLCGPVIFMTAHDEPATQHQARRAGGVVYLRKPFTAHSLIEVTQCAIAPPVSDVPPVQR